MVLGHPFCYRDGLGVEHDLRRASASAARSSAFAQPALGRGGNRSRFASRAGRGDAYTLLTRAPQLQRRRAGKRTPPGNASCTPYV